MKKNWAFWLQCKSITIKPASASGHLCRVTKIGLKSNKITRGAGQAWAWRRRDKLWTWAHRSVVDMVLLFMNWCIPSGSIIRFLSLVEFIGKSFEYNCLIRVIICVQQSASNRDDFIKIHWENIRSGRNHNFKKYDESTVTNFDVAYDYDSVMHYSSKAFSKNGKITIEPLVSREPTISNVHRSIILWFQCFVVISSIQTKWLDNVWAWVLRISRK